MKGALSRSSRAGRRREKIGADTTNESARGGDRYLTPVETGRGSTPK